MTNGSAPPDDQERHHRELREGRRVPVVELVVAEVQSCERVVENPVLVVRDPVPDLHSDHDGHRPDEHEARGEQDPDGPADADEEQGEERPDPDRQADVRDREDHRAQQRVPEHGVVEDRRVVGGADPDALVLDQLHEAVLLEREHHELVERVAEDRDDRDQHRHQKPVRPRRAQRTLPRQRATPPRPILRGLGGDRRSVREPGARHRDRLAVICFPSSRSGPTRCCRSRTELPA